MSAAPATRLLHALAYKPLDARSDTVRRAGPDPGRRTRSRGTRWRPL